jgi:hypothetical protein
MTAYVSARVVDEDADELVALTRSRGIKRPEMIREILRYGLAKARAEEEREAAERRADTGPPGEGG